MDGIYCQPDFYYEPRFWVFCDGSPHDEERPKSATKSSGKLIIAQGDEVWVCHYSDDLADEIASARTSSGK